MNAKRQVASIVAGTLLLWCAVGIALVYNHRTDMKNPMLSGQVRRQHESMLATIAGAFIVFNGVMTVLRIKQAARRQTQIAALNRPKS